MRQDSISWEDILDFIDVGLNINDEDFLDKIILSATDEELEIIIEKVTKRENDRGTRD